MAFINFYSKCKNDYDFFSKLIITVSQKCALYYTALLSEVQIAL